MSHFSYLHPSVVRQCCFIVASFNMLFSKPHVLPSKPRQAYEFCIWLGKNAWLPLDPPWPQHKGMLSYHLPWPFSLHSSDVQFLPASLALSSLWIWQSISKQNANHIESSSWPLFFFSFFESVWFCDGEIPVGCQKSWSWLCSSGKHTWLLDWQGGSPILLRQRQSLRSLQQLQPFYAQQVQSFVHAHGGSTTGGAAYTQGQGMGQTRHVPVAEVWLLTALALCCPFLQSLSIEASWASKLILAEPGQNCSIETEVFVWSACAGHANNHAEMSQWPGHLTFEVLRG